MSKQLQPRRLTVMISSTVRDLPEHRKQVEDACLRASMFPSRMEHLPAVDADAIAESLRLVDEADIYVGVFAFRYGHVPAGHDISITEMEYERARERGIPRLAFLMSDEHPVMPGDVEKGMGGDKIDALRERIGGERVAGFFASPETLRTLVLQALGEAKARIEAAANRESGAASRALSLHYVADIPTAPEPYVAHPYTLLQTRGLIGRRDELERLTDWIVHPEQFHHARILCVVAIGGMGKSALTWHWFEQVVAQEMKPLAGRMWWSFYESDARFENFVIRALAYVSRRSREEVAREPWHEREEALLRILDEKPFVLVLDGLERELVAYAGMCAAYTRDDDLDDETANRVAGAIGLPPSAGQSYVGRHPQRKTTDPRVGMFLRKLARVRASRILVSTRLFPADLQTETGDPWLGCAALFLSGLSASDALELWRAHGARGSREVMLPVFDRFERHPLLIQVLAGEVACFRKAPGDFDAWREANPRFDPFALPLVQVRAHVLKVALRGLSPAELRTLHVMAGFRMPTGLDTLEALLIRTGEEAEGAAKRKPFSSLGELDAALSDLEDRGLLGWDRRANRYDLHPIVRGVTWGGLDEEGRSNIHSVLQIHFEAMPEIDEDEVESLEDLTPGIELYGSVVGLGRYDDAFGVFRNRLARATHFRLSASHHRAEMLERLFPDGMDALPRLKGRRDQSWTLNELALAYGDGGRPGSAEQLLRRADEIDKSEGDDRYRVAGLCNLSDALGHTGGLYSAASAARQALLLAREDADRYHEAECLYRIGLSSAARGETAESEVALRRSLRIFVERSHRQGEGVVNAFLAERARLLQQPEAAQGVANRAWELAAILRYERDLIGAARVQGSAALLLYDLVTAEERLQLALTRARACQLIDEELPALIALAELHRRREEPDYSRELLDDVWDLAECGPYPLLHSDACNVLAQLERDAGNRLAAISAARRAFELAWCNGPPFAYKLGLDTARRHLAELDAPEPVLAPFDPSAYDPMPEVELDPDDEFHAGRKPESSGPVGAAE